MALYTVKHYVVTLLMWMIKPTWYLLFRMFLFHNIFDNVLVEAILLNKEAKILLILSQTVHSGGIPIHLVGVKLAQQSIMFDNAHICSNVTLSFLPQLDYFFISCWPPFLDF